MKMLWIDGKQKNKDDGLVEKKKTKIKRMVGKCSQKA